MQTNLLSGTGDNKRLFSLSFAANVAHNVIHHICPSSPRVRYKHHPLYPCQAWSRLLDILALSHLQCFPQHHCIMLHLHRIASALPLQGWPPFHSPAPLFSSSLVLLYLLPPTTTTHTHHPSPVSGCCQSVGVRTGQAQ